MKYQLTVFHGGSKKIFLYPPEKLLVSVLGGCLKTETGILHEILTDNFSWGGLQKFSYTPPEKLLVSVWGGSKN